MPRQVAKKVMSKIPRQKKDLKKVKERLPTAARKRSVEKLTQKSFLRADTRRPATATATANATATATVAEATENPHFMLLTMHNAEAFWRCLVKGDGVLRHISVAVPVCIFREFENHFKFLFKNTELIVRLLETSECDEWTSGPLPVYTQMTAIALADFANAWKMTQNYGCVLSFEGFEEQRQAGWEWGGYEELILPIDLHWVESLLYHMCKPPMGTDPANWATRNSLEKAIAIVDLLMQPAIQTYVDCLTSCLIVGSSALRTLLPKSKAGTRKIKATSLNKKVDNDSQEASRLLAKVRDEKSRALVELERVTSLQQLLHNTMIYIDTMSSYDANDSAKK